MDFSNFSVELWVIFCLTILSLIVIDLGLISSGKTKISFKNAAMHTALWVILSLSFATWLYLYIGKKHSIDFITGYIVELSLSIDNIFVFILIFKYFNINASQQHRILLWGIIGAIVLRLLMITGGILLVNNFSWIFYVFGLILIISSYKILRTKDNDSSHDNLTNNFLVKFLKRYFRFSDQIVGNEFILKKDGKVFITPLAMVLLLIEQADLVFALDSIPAILAITQEPFIVFTSNIFAILGLRSMYFLVINLLERFSYLKYSLAFILLFIGIKMLISVHGIHIPTLISLVIIIFSILIAVFLSYFSRGEKRI